MKTITKTFENNTRGKMKLTVGINPEYKSWKTNSHLYYGTPHKYWVGITYLDDYCVTETYNSSDNPEAMIKTFNQLLETA